MIAGNNSHLRKERQLRRFYRSVEKSSREEREKVASGGDAKDCEAPVQKRDRQRDKNVVADPERFGSENIDQHKEQGACETPNKPNEEYPRKETGNKPPKDPFPRLRSVNRNLVFAIADADR